MIRKSTWEACFKHPKAFALPSNWRELGVFCLLLCRVALVTGTMWSLPKEMPLYFCTAPKSEWGPVSLSEFLAHFTLQGEALKASPPLHPISSSPHMAARDLQHFLFGEGWELTVFMKWTWPRKAFSMLRLCTWKRPQLDFPSSSVWVPIY